MSRLQFAASMIPLFFLSSVAAAASDPVPDPFFGDWQGAALVAQVIPRGGDRYQINFLPEFDQRCEALCVAEAQASGGVLRFEQGGWRGEIRGDRFAVNRPTDGGSAAIELQRVVRESPTVGAKPPASAVVLFDGSGFDQWEIQGNRGQTQEIAWQIRDGAMLVTPVDAASRAGHSLVTRDAFQDVRLHLEFRLPLMADKTGQARANGGVVLEDTTWCEIQVLDSYGLAGLDNECGGIYKVAAPAVNMCRPPLQWQTYDIEYHAPRYDAEGKRTRAGRISVNHNGTMIHENVGLPDSPEAEKRRAAGGIPVQVGRILLHYHKDPVEYRNIWLEPLPAG